MRKSQSLAVLAALGFAAVPMGAVAQDGSGNQSSQAEAEAEAEANAKTETGKVGQVPGANEAASDTPDAGTLLESAGDVAVEDGDAGEADAETATSAPAMDEGDATSEGAQASESDAETGDPMSGTPETEAPGDAAAETASDMPAQETRAETTSEAADEASPGMDTAAPADVPAPTASVLTADLIGGEGDVIGSTKLTSGPNGLLLEITVQQGGLAPGWHGLHLHQVGDCSDTGSFTRSGGHVGKIDGGHGLLNPKGPEAGDLPNLHVHADGSAVMETFTNLASLQDLSDRDGTALILHESRDDHRSQPIGGAGARIACAVLMPQQP